jgi:hypothetical protein
MEWICSYDGESDYEGYHNGKAVRLAVRYAAPYNPAKFSEGVYPKQIAGVGTIRLYHSAYEGFPPAELVDAVKRLRQGKEVLNFLGLDDLVPIQYSMERHEYVDAKGNSAHI